MASLSSHTSMSFQVKRCEPELVVPAKPTPREVKKLSDIDNQQALRFQLPGITFYKNNPNPSMEGKDPAKVIREALGRALVYYYPLAGRLFEDCNNNNVLMVDCNGQGALFIEADADVEFDQLDHPIQPPFPFLDEVLYNAPGSDGILGCPLLLIQVTRLKCGGFIFAIRMNHTMCDGFGLHQFLKALIELAQGAEEPSVPPVWRRELLNARNPPRITCKHKEFQEEMTNYNDELNNLVQTTHMIQCSFFFSHSKIMTIRKHLPPHLATCSRFELLAACAWRCRTLALNLDPEEVIQISCVFNARANNIGLNLPLGYYGNVIAGPCTLTNAGVLCKNPIGYAVELVKKVKSEMSAEYIRSAADFIASRGRPPCKIKGNFVVSDITNAPFQEIDFGWGCPDYIGVAVSFPLFSFFVKCVNNGEAGTLLLTSLPLLAVERFQQELKKLTEGPIQNIKSML
ncbi:hypothetical protein FNV43_RR08398 [Rhamnella rubrinervis]|uniref:Methanol O-anthraniloyltransferase-like n=1 Tax=Rhamnella rubrinervis TaxID=2594499 RepID=A0A8K0MJA7_9ROSA|nr:hypothetical protein FNV43_RR08398 [Rhamnella rubrinervis]